MTVIGALRPDEEKMFEGQPKGFPFDNFDMADVMLPEEDADMGIPSEDDDDDEEEIEAESGFGSVIGACKNTANSNVRVVGSKEVASPELGAIYSNANDQRHKQLWKDVKPWPWYRVLACDWRYKWFVYLVWYNLRQLDGILDFQHMAHDYFTKLQPVAVSVCVSSLQPCANVYTTTPILVVVAWLCFVRVC
jgi:hypothetical protein